MSQSTFEYAGFEQRRTRSKPRACKSATAAAACKNVVALTLSLAAMAFGLFWLVWILYTTLQLGIGGLSIELFTQIDAAAEHRRRRSRQRDRRQPDAGGARDVRRHADRHSGGRLSRRVRPEGLARERHALHQRHPAVGAVDRDRPVRLCAGGGADGPLQRLGRRDRARAAADSDRDPHHREHAEAGAERAARSGLRARHAEVEDGAVDHAEGVGARAS